MADVVSVTVTAKDGATKVFQAVSSSAQKMGSDVEGAGKKGADGVEKMGKAAEQSGSKMKSLAAEATAIGAIMGVVAAGASKAGAAYQTQQRQIQVLGKLYGDQADEVIKFSEAMQDSTRFSNDAVRESAQIFATLRNNYAVSQDDIQRLISISADLASAYGISIQDASQRIQSAIRGEGEAAEALGLTMNQQAIDRDNLTLSMSNQEAAQFRLNALYQQTSNLEGYAQERAANAGGAMRQLINNLQDGAQAAGGFLGPIGQVAAELAPIATAAPVAGAGIGALVGKLKETTVGARAAQLGISGLGVAISPLGVAIAGVVAVGGLMIGSWLEQRAAAQEYDATLKTLDGTLEGLERRGNTTLAQMGKDAEGFVDKMANLELDLPQPDPGASDAIKQNYLDQLDAIEKLADRTELATPVIDKFNEALGDPDVNAQAYFTWVNSELARAAKTANDATDDVEVLQAILERPLSDFSYTKIAEDLGKVKAAASEVIDVFKGMPKALDDLRIDGKGTIADQVDTLHTNIVDAFTVSDTEAVAANAKWYKMLPAEDQMAVLDTLTSKTDISTESAKSLDTAWGRIEQKMASGNLDNAKIMADVLAVINDTSLNGDQKVAEIEKISNNLSQYIDKYAELKDAQTEFLANGDNLLNWWQEYDKALNSNQRAMTDGTASAEALAAANEKAAQQRAFRLDVQIADGVQESAQALDQVLRTFGEIDALGQRSASSGSIADKLIGTPGETGELQDLWTRIADGTSSAVLAQDDYNRAIESGIAIQESNVRVQDDLNVVRAKQLPLLAQEQAAYESNIDRIAGLNAVEARRVLLLQDTAVQTQVAGLYSQAYAAAIGEVPKEVATRMILEAAEADAGIKDLLLNLGLLKQNADGTISVNFPDAESVGASIDRVTLALLHMQAVAEGKSVYDLAVEIYGEDEAKRLLGMVEEADGKTSTMGLTVVSTGVDEAGNNVQTIQLADGTQVTIVVGVDGADALGQADSDIKQVTLADGTVVTVKTEVDTTGWDKKTVEDIINQGDAVKVNAVLAPPNGMTWQDWNASDGPGENGPLPDIHFKSVADPPEPPDLSGVPPVRVKAELVFEGAENRPDSSTSAGTGQQLSQDRTVTINTVLTGTADADLQGLQKTAGDLDGTEVTVTGTAEVSSAVIGISNVQTQADTFGATSVSAKLGADDFASETIRGVIGLMEGFQSKTVSLNVMTQYSTVGSPANYGGGSGSAEMFGGVAGYALGGTVGIRAAEAGPEWIDYPSGGGTWAMTDGLYSVPQGSYVNTAPASRGMTAPGGGMSLHLEIHGDVYGVEDLQAKVGSAVIEAMMAENRRYKREQGVV